MITHELPEPPTTTLASTVIAPVPELKAVIGPLKNFVLGLAGVGYSD